MWPHRLVAGGDLLSRDLATKITTKITIDIINPPNLLNLSVTPINLSTTYYPK